MPNYITRKELEAVASYLYCLNETEEDTPVTVEASVFDSNGDLLGWIVFENDDDPGYVFKAAV